MFHGHQDEEVRKLKGVLHFVGQDIVSGVEQSSGHLHVGGKDCLHWMQPGIPDVMAAEIVKKISTTLFAKSVMSS